jgi:hypothetical protein
MKIGLTYDSLSQFCQIERTFEMRGVSRQLRGLSQIVD